MFTPCHYSPHMLVETAVKQERIVACGIAHDMGLPIRKRAQGGLVWQPRMQSCQSSAREWQNGAVGADRTERSKPISANATKGASQAISARPEIYDSAVVYSTWCDSGLEPCIIVQPLSGTSYPYGISIDITRDIAVGYQYPPRMSI